MRVAAIDCGTNTIRLLVADPDGRGGLVERARLVEFVGLGQGVDATGGFAPEAVARTTAACRGFARIIAEHGAGAVRFVATSAARDAANREALLDPVAAILGPGARLDVIDGEEEARLSFTGALSGAGRPLDPILLIDAGGGSTELVRGTRAGVVLQAVSLDLGSRRLRERYLCDDPPAESQISRARAAVRAGLGAADIDLETVRTFVGVAGTITSMAALTLGLRVYDRTRVHGARLSLDDIGRVTDRLLSSSAAQIAALGPVDPQRAAVLSAGALLVDEIAQHVGSTTLVVSEADILDGIALDLLAGATPTPS